MIYHRRFFDGGVFKFIVAMITALILTVLLFSLMRSTSLLRSKISERSDTDEDFILGDLYSLDPARRYAASLKFHETRYLQDDYVLIQNVDIFGGNFECENSANEGSCVFLVHTTKEAKTICHRYEECIGFILTRDMIVHLKKNVFSVSESQSSSLFVIWSVYQEMEKELTVPLRPTPGQID